MALSRIKLVNIIVLPVALLSVLIPLAHRETTSEMCTSPTCVTEKFRIIHQVDSNVNPCENFYEFVCGSSQRTSSIVTALKTETKRQMIQLYKAPSKLNEHPMVFTMKKLFKTCVEEAAIDSVQKNVEEIRETLKMAGGWPVLEGSSWDEINFEWLQATHKFREFGYDHGMFLNVVVAEDPRNNSRHIFKVSLPTLDMGIKESMIEVAVLLGADKHNASFEVEATYNDMFRFFYGNGIFRWINNEDQGSLFTVASYQNQQNSSVNWLQFINNIVGPAVHISKKDDVVFPDPEKVTIWLNSLSKIPKRSQANYMMWKAIEEIVLDLQYGVKTHKHNSNFWHLKDFQEHYCLEKIQNIFRLLPNPIDVLYIRKYLPIKKLKMVQELTNYVKQAFLELLEKCEWLVVTDKMVIIKTIRKMSRNIIIGAPEIYFDDKILDKINVDLKEITNKGFLSLLLKINRNYKSFLYKQIYSSVSETKSLSWNLLDITEEVLDYYARNTIVLPVTILQGTLFNENRPNYLNYGSLGSFIGSDFVNQFINLIIIGKWSDKTQKGFLKVRGCLLQQIMDYLEIKGVPASCDFNLLCHSLSTNISYAAYTKWLKSNGNEQQLVSTYTNEQLFWISAGSIYCNNLYPVTIRKQHSFYVSGIEFNNDNFAKDFNCPVSSKMNPIKKCYMF